MREFTCPCSLVSSKQCPQMWQAEPPQRQRDGFASGWDDCNIGNFLKSLLWPCHMSQEVWVSLYSLPPYLPLLRLRKTGVSGARLLPYLQRGLARQMWYILTRACVPSNRRVSLSGCAWDLGLNLCAVCYDHFGKRQSRNVVPNVVHTRVCSSLTAHDNRASELRNRTNRKRMSTVPQGIHFVTTVTLRHGQQNKLPWCDVSDRHSKTAIFVLAQVRKYPLWHGAHCLGARTTRRPRLKSLTAPRHFARFPSFHFPKSTEADCWRARDGVAHQNPSNLFWSSPVAHPLYVLI